MKQEGARSRWMEILRQKINEAPHRGPSMNAARPLRTEQRTFKEMEEGIRTNILTLDMARAPSYRLLQVAMSRLCRTRILSAKTCAAPTSLLRAMNWDPMAMTKSGARMLCDRAAATRRRSTSWVAAY